MSAEIRTLGRHAAIYGLGNMLAKLASIVMLPIYTRHLTPADYGVLELLSMTIDLIGILTGIALSQSVFPFYAEYREKGEENEVISTAAIGMTVLAALTAVFGLLISPLLAKTLTPTNGSALYFRLFFLIDIAQTAELVPFMMCRALHRSMLVVVVNLARLLALISLNILFVVHFEMGVLGVLIGNLIVSTAVALGMLIFVFKQTGIVFSMHKFKAMARFAYPVALVSLGNFVLLFSDRYFINHYVGPAAVGLYSLAYRFAMVISNFVFNPFQQIWGPQRFLIAKQANARDIYRRVFLYLNIALGVVALVIALFVRDLLKVMAANSFWAAYRVVPFLLVIQILHHWTAYNNLGLFLTKTTKKFAWASTVAIPAVLLLNIALIPRFSVWGAVAATFIAYVLRFLLIQTLSQRQYRIDYDWARIAKLYIILVAAFLARAPLGDIGIFASVTVGVLLFTVAVSGIWTIVLNADERRAVVTLVRGRLKLPRRVPVDEVDAAVGETPMEVAVES